MSDNLENKAARGSISQIILKALSECDKYGYEICKDIEKLTDGKLILKQPSLYSSLRRMEEQNLISSYWKDSLIGGRRHYYSLTQKGKDYFEENKKFWQEDDELLNNLPQKEVDENRYTTTTSTPSQNFNQPTNEEHSTYIANQENLFNLKTNKEIKKIDANQAEQDDEFNKSFFQFDFFDQNIKFVKENSKTKQEISAFTNKFSEMDNHAEEIEPVKQFKNENLSAYITYKPEDANENLENEKASASTEINQNSEQFAKKNLNYQPVLKNNFSKIERENVYNQETNTNSSNYTENFEDNTKKHSTLLSEQYDEADNNYENDLINNTVQITEYTNVEIIDSSNNTVEKKDISAEEITWDFETNLSDDNSLFEANDYKDVIGKLYNNSRLQDPYEQNKFQTFKEIFPSSQLKVKESVPSEQTEINTVSINNNNNNQNDNQVEAYIKSNQESNIDCEDIKKLNSLYNLQGISIKIHKTNEYKKTKKTYTDKNKLNMVCGWITSIIMLLEIALSFLILRNNNLLIGKQPYVYYLGVALTLNYCIICSLENIFDRFKLVIINKPFKKTFMQRLFAFIILAIVIFAVNIVFGMTNLTEIKYLSYWLLPLILSTNLLTSCIVYYLLLKSKNFNS